MHFLGGPKAPLAIAFPYSFILLSSLPSSAALLSVTAGMLQGPLYGFVFGLFRPIDRHRGTWVILVLAHLALAVYAYFR